MEHGTNIRKPMNQGAVEAFHPICQPASVYSAGRTLRKVTTSNLGKSPFCPSTVLRRTFIWFIRMQYVARRLYIASALSRSDTVAGKFFGWESIHQSKYGRLSTRFTPFTTLYLLSFTESLKTDVYITLPKAQNYYKHTFNKRPCSLPKAPLEPIGHM